MDDLDQYTNVDWFLQLNPTQLGNFYKETEDIWNYRLNLSETAKRRIYPFNQKVFPLSVNLVKSKTDALELQHICLDFMEKLVTSAPKREDRVNGCMYTLLGLVIVSSTAAEALPSLYSMVSIHGNSDEVVPI